MTPDPDLSAAGRGRRDHIGRLAVRAAVGRRRRRRVGRFTVMVAVIGAAFAALRPRRPVDRPTVVIRTPAPAASPAGVAVTFVPTDPTIVDRLRVATAPPRWRTIGDRELLDSLAAAGRPAGLVRTDDGRVVLVEP